MTHPDPDLSAVRTTLSARVADTDASVARAWTTLGARRAAGQRRARSRSVRVLVPIGAAAAVAALALGATALFGTGTDDGSAPAVAAATTSPPVAAPTPAPPDRIRIDDGVLVDGEPVAVGEVIAAMVTAAGDTAAVTVEDREMVYVRTVEHVDRTRLHEAWYHVDGMPPTTIKIDGKVIAESEEHTGERFGSPPDFYRPTPQWLTSLPVEPDAMLSLLQEATSPGPVASDRYVFKEVGDLLSRTDLLLTPEVRIAVYQALASVESVSAVELEVEGRQLFGLRRSHGGHADELLMDPATGHVVGTRVVLPDQDRPVTSARIWTQTVVHQDEEGVSR